MEDIAESQIQYAIKAGPLKVNKIDVLKGANYFSAGPVVIIRLDLEEYDEVFTDVIPHFLEKLEKILPSLQQHHCSEGRPGGFFYRVKEGTLLGHVAEHIAIEFQALAGMDVRFGKTRSTHEKGVYNVVFRYFDEYAGLYAGKAAINLVNSLLTDEDFDKEEILSKLIQLRETRLLGPSTQSIVDEAQRREIPVMRLDPYNLIQLGTGKYQQRIRATVTSNTNFVAVENVLDPFLTTLMLRDAGIPIARTLKTANEKEAFLFMKKLDKPVSVRSPKNKKHRSAFCGLYSLEQLEKAFNLCLFKHNEVIVQEHVPGNTYRFLVINNTFVAASRLHPPEIIGNGKDSLATLIQRLNLQQQREPGDKGALSLLEPNDIMLETLAFKGYSLNSIIPENVKVILCHSTTPALGAMSQDVTGLVHPINRYLAERASEICNLNVAGIDFVCPDIGKPIKNGEGAAINVVAAPDFRMHINPWSGKARNVAKPFLDMLFPNKSEYKIPVFSVSGSAGKSVCAHFLHFALNKLGYKTGLTCSDGVFINGRRIVNGNMANHHAAQLVLKDTSIDCAILETSTESIIKEGLGYEFADFGIVLNVYDTIPHNSDIRRTDDLAYAKSVVAEEVYKNGFTILNADDELVLEMRDRLYSKEALFSQNPQNEQVQAFIKQGGIALVLENQIFYLHNERGKTAIVHIDEVPLLKNNTLFLHSFMAGILSLSLFDVEAPKIKEIATIFQASWYNIPGRRNVFLFKKQVIEIDRPSSREALLELKNRIGQQTHKTSVFIDFGDNFPEALWTLLAEIFDTANLHLHLFSSKKTSKKSKTQPIVFADHKEIVHLKSLTGLNILHHGQKLQETQSPSLDEKMEIFKQLVSKNSKVSIYKDMQAILNSMEKMLQNENIHILSWNFDTLMNELNPKFHLY